MPFGGKSPHACTRLATFPFIGLGAYYFHSANSADMARITASVCSSYSYWIRNSPEHVGQLIVGICFMELYGLRYWNFVDFRGFVVV